jgi:type I restriction enzyme, S subunit
MIEDLKPYAEYKESGLPWLGEVPGHWGAERAKWLFTKMDRPVREDDEVVTCFRDGVVTLRKNRRLRGFTEATLFSGYQGIRQGDLVIHGMDAFAGAIGVSDSDGKATPVYNVCQPRLGVNAGYYAQLVRQMSQSQWILALSKGIRERSTDFRFEMFGNQRVPLPPPEEQAAIVRFLDWSNGRLERAIRAKRKVIALLNEQKQAIIHRAVTRGLDPSVPLKPSGIPWLGGLIQSLSKHRAAVVAAPSPATL